MNDALHSKTESMFEGTKKRSKSIYQHFDFDKEKIIEEQNICRSMITKPSDTLQKITEIDV